MEVFDDKLFLGFHNGRLYSFNGNYIRDENSSNRFDYSINELYSDGIMLFIALENTDDFWVMRKINSVYDFSKIDITI